MISGDHKQVSFPVGGEDLVLETDFRIYMSVSLGSTLIPQICCEAPTFTSIVTCGCTDNVSVSLTVLLTSWILQYANSLGIGDMSFLLLDPQ